jgi:hypothetical protein
MAKSMRGAKMLAVAVCVLISLPVSMHSCYPHPVSLHMRLSYPEFGCMCLH